MNPSGVTIENFGDWLYFPEGDLHEMTEDPETGVWQHHVKRCPPCRMTLPRTRL